MSANQGTFFARDSKSVVHRVWNVMDEWTICGKRLRYALDPDGSHSHFVTCKRCEEIERERVQHERSQIERELARRKREYHRKTVGPYELLPEQRFDYPSDVGHGITCGMCGLRHVHIGRCPYCGNQLDHEPRDEGWINVTTGSREGFLMMVEALR